MKRTKTLFGGPVEPFVRQLVQGRQRFLQWQQSLWCVAIHLEFFPANFQVPLLCCSEEQLPCQAVLSLHTLQEVSYLETQLANHSDHCQSHQSQLSDIPLQAFATLQYQFAVVTHYLYH